MVMLDGLDGGEPGSRLVEIGIVVEITSEGRPVVPDFVKISLANSFSEVFIFLSLLQG